MADLLLFDEKYVDRRDALTNAVARGFCQDV